jgi:hypothetical protein
MGGDGASIVDHARGINAHAAYRTYYARRIDAHAFWIGNHAFCIGADTFQTTADARHTTADSAQRTADVIWRTDDAFCIVVHAFWMGSDACLYRRRYNLDRGRCILDG